MSIGRAASERDHSDWHDVGRAGPVGKWLSHITLTRQVNLFHVNSKNVLFYETINSIYWRAIVWLLNIATNRP